MKRILFLCALLLAAFPQEASAHASMIAVSPTYGTVMGSLPQTVTMTFDEEIDSMTISASIKTGSFKDQPGEDIAYLESSTTGYQKEIVFNLPKDAPTDVTGDVVVYWRSVGLDGHQMEGYIPYKITSGASQGSVDSTSTTVVTATSVVTDDSKTPVLTADNPDKNASRDMTRALLRFASFIAAALLAGALYLSRQSSIKALDGHLSPLFDALKKWTLVSLAASSAILASLPVKSYLTGPSLSRQGLFQVLTSASVFLWAALAAMALFSRKRVAMMPAVPALFALASVGVSHAASAKWAPAALVFGFVHQAAILLWAGPLFALSALYVMSPIAKHDKFSTLYIKPLKSFSALSTTMVALAVISGARQVIGILGNMPSLSLDQLGSWESLVILKTVLFLAVVAPLGLWHHTALKKASQGIQNPPTLRRFILVESGALVIVAALAALLAQTSI